MNTLFTSFIKKLTKSVGQSIDEEQIEVYVYGLQALIYTTIPCSILLILSSLFKIPTHMIMWYFLFITLRKFAGGYHASHPLICFLYTIIIGTSYIILEKINYKINYTIYTNIIIICLFIFLYIVPITTKSFTKRVKLLCKLKVCTILILSFVTFTYVPLFQTCFIHATISTLFLCIAGKFHK